MSSPQLMIDLNDGTSMPQLGLGVWRAAPDDARIAVREALQSGYRAIDTAAIYKNEEAVGEGMRESGVARSDIYLTTKVWNEDQGFDSALSALQKSLERLGTDYLDLLLIHWACPQQNRYLDTWRALIKAKEQGLVHSIGVSNFHAPHLERIIKETGVTPVLNQIELHPYLQQREMRKVNAAHNIRTQSWSPLAQNQALTDETIIGLADKYGKTPAQIIIRWHLDNGLIVIPKSVTPERIRSNFDVFDFELDSDDLGAIDSLDRNERLGPNPEVFG